MTAAARINPLSKTAFQLDPLFEGSAIGLGTAFFYIAKAEQTQRQDWLVTAKHNLTGLHPETGKALHSRCALPDGICIYEAVFSRHSQGVQVARVEREIPLYADPDRTNANWWCHPEPTADVAALRIDRYEESWQIPVNDTSALGTVDFRFTAGCEAFVVGYPQGFSSRGGFPIWKRATIASEPELSKEPAFLIDTATRQGMSGSPVFVKNTGIIVPRGVPEAGPFTGEEIIGEAYKFAGIYTARPLADDKGTLAQLGKVYTTRAIDELLRNPVRGTSPF